MHAEVLRKHRLGRARNPIGEQECRVLGEVAVVEDEEELGAIGTEALQRVRVARWEVPEVALLEVIDKATTLGVERSDADLALENVRPLSLLVPMQLTDNALVQTHIHTSELLAGSKLANRCLSGPPTLFDANMRVCKRPAHVRNGTMIRTRRANQVRILPFARSVARSQNVRPVAIALLFESATMRCGVKTTSLTTGSGVNLLPMASIFLSHSS